MTNRTHALGRDLHDARVAMKRADHARMQVTANAVAHLVKLGHRPTGETIEAHFAGACQCHTPPNPPASPDR